MDVEENSTKTLRKPSIEEVKEKIHNHILYLKGDNDKVGNFSNLDLTDGYESTEVDFNEYGQSEPYLCFNSAYGQSFCNKNLKEAIFNNSKLKGCNFSSSNLEGVDFRGADFNFSQFSKEQENQAIFTDRQHKIYIENKKLEEENLELKKEVKEKDNTIESTSKEQTKTLIEGFEEIKNDFLYEERKWLITSMFTFFIGFTFIFIPLFDIIFFEYIKQIVVGIFTFNIILVIGIISGVISNSEIEKDQKSFFKKSLIFVKETWLPSLIGLIVYGFGIYFSSKLEKSSKPLLNIEPRYAFGIITLFIFSFLYFSIIQYSKAKQIRIENQNKIALLHGFQAIKTESTSGLDKLKFYENIANVVFTKVYNTKEPNLPLEKILDLVKK